MTESENTEELHVGSREIYTKVVNALHDTGFLTEHLTTAFVRVSSQAHRKAGSILSRAA